MRLLLTSLLLSFFLHLTSWSAKAEATPLPFKLASSITKDALEWEQVSISDAAAAQKFMNSRLDYLYKMFEPEIDPYSGKNSLPDMCQKAQLPPPFKKENARESLQMASIFSSKDKVVGFCSSADTILKTQYLMLFCARTNALYIVKHFYPKSAPWIKTPVASCK